MPTSSRSFPGIGRGCSSSRALVGADLSGADLTQADLTKAEMDEVQAAGAVIVDDASEVGTVERGPAHDRATDGRPPGGTDFTGAQDVAAIVADWVHVQQEGTAVRLEGQAVRSWLEQARRGALDR